MRSGALAATLALAAACGVAAPGVGASPPPGMTVPCPWQGHGHGHGQGHGHPHSCEPKEDGGGDPGGGETPGGGESPAPAPPAADPAPPAVTAPRVAAAPAIVAQDTVAPSLSRPTVTPTRFRAARRGRAIAAAPVGTRIAYTSSEPARVRFTVLKARLTVRRCRLPAHASRHRRCIRYRRLGRFTHSGAAGENAFRFRGRVAGRRLRPGRYRLVAVATDASGNRSPSRRVRFDIVR